MNTHTDIDTYDQFVAITTDDTGKVVSSQIVCEGYNVAGAWVNCDRTDPHGHGIEWDEINAA